MSVGFGHTTQTTNQYINEFLRRERIRWDTKQQQVDWYNDYTSRNYQYTVEELLNPKRDELTIEHNPHIEWKRATHKGLKVLVQAENGLWRLGVLRNPMHKFYDFTISVRAGGGKRFHPDAIEQCITKKYGSVVYQEWRAMVLDDLDSLKTLVKEVRDRIDFVAPSIVCCDRSARLCKSVGIPVKGQFAFLFPSSYSA